MTSDFLKDLILRDLDKLSVEVSSYDKPQKLWMVADGITNSGGNLCLHIIGNLNTFIGANLGGTDYIRDRVSEFNNKDISVKELQDRIIDLKGVVSASLSSLSIRIIENRYPIDVLGYPMTTEYFLLHLYGHLNYHLGQINYHRRFIG